MPKRERDELFDVEVVESCEAGICPRCGGNLEVLGGGDLWVLGVVRVADYVIEADYGAGYYAVRDPHIGFPHVR